MPTPTPDAFPVARIVEHGGVPLHDRTTRHGGTARHGGSALARASDGGRTIPVPRRRRPLLWIVVLAGVVVVALVVAWAVRPRGGDPVTQPAPTPNGTPSSTPSPSGVVRDDFDGTAGSPPDPSVWTAQTGAGGWGNGELQTYQAANGVLDGSGHLVLTAHVGGTPATPTYTSARLTTAGKFSFTTGTLSARIELPDGQGLLPAFWLLGSDVDHVGWPAAGEVDIVETPNTTADSVHTVHAPSTTSDTQDVASSTTVHHSTPLSDGFHVYSVSRTADSITTAIDGHTAMRITRSTAPPTMRWVFDQPMDVLFSLAVGGNWPGPPDASTPTTSRMVIDWIQVDSRA
ncbi:glycoside hydrolase family 16 protein [Curtobacterium sp. MCBD17_013]|uniref:glycoside hydrolase family 16 protein n=1 Tax=unclassified Curtobacterium TaxID=257496 RepID=UPI000DA7CC5F|nr:MULTISPECIES: glycoside hydrolase family 16 protein [unclassified Curtobacterium]PZF57082.1 glycoside hydrolase family 16 protein [Curtobacterium sp. MCBD17_013]WIB62751.1 glycoside hydrolase family 16 protein [Curtobacterium sp. MCBD17_040]WIB66588.1 glycoside hydrolase family 16 protein [Curtobacterium sp. MCBD17_035]